VCHGATLGCAGTHLHEYKAYNGYTARLIDAKGSTRLGIEPSKARWWLRGVLLDIARFRGADVVNGLAKAISTRAR